MAFAVGRSIASANRQDGISNPFPPEWAFTTSGNLNVGELGILVLADVNDITSITDAAGNIWTKIAEHANSNNSAYAGSICSIYYTIASSTLLSGGTITVIYNGNASGGKAVTGFAFTLAKSTITITGINTLSDDAADPGSITSNPSTGNVEHLFIRGCAGETNSTIYTPSANFTAFTHTSSQCAADVGGTGPTAARGEYRIVTASSNSTDPSAVSANWASIMVAIDEGTIVRMLASTGVGK
jgi:hypothetical protein